MYQHAFESGAKTTLAAGYWLPVGRSSPATLSAWPSANFLRQTCIVGLVKHLSPYKYKSLHCLAPPHLSDDCQLVTDVGRRHLRLADVHTCTVPRTSQGSAIKVLGLPDHGCGTVCPLNCDSKTFASPSLGGYLRHFCSLTLGAL